MEDYESQAAEIGREHGTNAAQWVFDGNTTDETYRIILNGIDAGDPVIYDAYRVPNLSGEFADDYSSLDLQRDLGFVIDVYREDAQEQTEALEEACYAYEDAASEAFWLEVERLAREHLAG